MKSVILGASLVFFTMSATVLANEGSKCPKEVQEKLLKIRKVCSNQKSEEVCNSIPQGALCEEMINHFSKAVALHTQEIEKSLIHKDLSKPEIRKEIKAEIKKIEKLTKILGDEKDVKKFDDEIRPLYKIVSKFSKRNADFMNKIHENGLSSREIVKRLLDQEGKARLLGAVSIAFEKYQADFKESPKNNKGQENFKKYLYDAVVNDRVLASALPITKNKGRYVASVGLVLFGCAEHFDDEPGMPDIHILLYGKKRCGWGVEEKVFGPGLYAGSGAKAAAFICLSVDTGFKGVGVTVGAGGLFAGGSTGVYVGTGICVKAEVAIGVLGAYAGFSYLNIRDDGLNVFKEMIDI